MMQADDGDDDAGSDDDAAGAAEWSPPFAAGAVEWSPPFAAPRASDDARLIDRKVQYLRAFDATELFTTTAAAAAAADGSRPTTVGMEGGAVIFF
eukprot:COSAG06_NODE_28543_length_572_cov_1.143763_1_plen_95_part_00